MTSTSIKLSDTARAMLTLAATRPDRLVRPPQLPTAAARQVVRSLLNNGLVEEVPAPVDEAAYIWREGDDGVALMLHATAAGMAAIGVAPQEPTTDLDVFRKAVATIVHERGWQAEVMDEAEATIMVEDGFANSRDAALVAGDIIAWLEEREAEQDEDAPTAIGAPESPAAAPVAVSAEPGQTGTPVAESRPARHAAPARASLRQAAQTLLAAWDAAAARAPALDAPMAALRAALGEGPRRDPHPVRGPRQPREDTKQARVLAMLRRPEGATVAQIAEAMGWQQHTVRGFFAGLKKRQGISVEAAERIRQVGPDRQGAKGSYTIYRITEAA
jgi:hypothetical protein